ncbi:MAG: type II secretion system F family protein [Candidatus Omnitrophica bacterium]|nr:type II secretion system F family protein [Candidatus Omnitrophota bacterium]
MPLYTYKVRDRQGDLVSGSLEAADEKDLISKLDRLGYSIIEVTPEKTADTEKANILDRFERLEKREVILFTRQLATLLRTGTSISTSLTTICTQTQNKKFRTILEDVTGSVHSGTSFSESLSKHPKVFSELFVSMVKVGEAGGMLDNVLERLATLGLQELEMSSRIKSALVYPIVLVVVAFVVVNFLIVGVLPKFVDIFRATGAELPMVTQVVLTVSHIMRKYWLLFMIMLGAGIAWFRAYISKEEGMFKFHLFVLKVPIFGDLFSKIQVSRFCRILSTLISSGIPLLQALGVVEKTVGSVVIRRAIQKIREAISQGNPIVNQFKESGMFSPMVIQMIATGERSGKLDQMLEDVASFYDPEIEYTIKNLTSLLEPFMLLTMGIMVAFIALSVLLPIFNLIKVFRA